MPKPYALRILNRRINPSKFQMIGPSTFVWKNVPTKRNRTSQERSHLYLRFHWLQLGCNDAFSPVLFSRRGGRGVGIDYFISYPMREFIAIIGIRRNRDFSIPIIKTSTLGGTALILKNG